MSVAIVTDSIACLPDEMVREYDIKVIAPNILFEHKTYRDGIDLTPAQAYEFLEKAPDQFSTSSPSLIEYMQVYREVSNLGNSILCITLSSKLSTMYNVARLAKKQLTDELKGTTIEVLDSLTAAGAEGLVVLAAARAAAAGKGLQEVLDVAKRARGETGLIGLLQNVRHVYRSGRVPKLAAQIGSMLNIKPLVTISGGTVRLTDLTRSTYSGIERMIELVKKRVGNRQVRVSLMHADAPVEADNLRKRIAAEFNYVEIWVTYFSPIMGYSTGRGTLAVAYQMEPVG